MPDPTKRTPADVLRDLNSLRQGRMPTGDKAPVAPPPQPTVAQPPVDPVESARAAMMEKKMRAKAEGRSLDVNLPLERKATLAQMR